jgi:hypothetical protein
MTDLRNSPALYQAIRNIRCGLEVCAQLRILVGQKTAVLQDTPNGFGRSGIAVWFELLILAEGRGSRLAGDGGGSVKKY